jgi:hypothetical protein
MCSVGRARETGCIQDDYRSARTVRRIDFAQKPQTTVKLVSALKGARSATKTQRLRVGFKEGYAFQTR